MSLGSVARPDLDKAPSLWQRIRSTYETAQHKGAIYRIRTRPQELHDPHSGLRFVLQVSEALRDKPKPPKEQAAQPVDAFETLDPDLTVVDALTRSHTLRLNKFNVVDFHSLVITRAFEPQTDRLTTADWEATLLALEAYPEGALCFFNGGERAGSSQPRKHLQLIPLANDGEPSAPLPLHAAASTACKDSSSLQATPVSELPFQAFAASLPERLEPDAVQQAYESLMAARPSSSQEADYSLLLARRLMLLVPRSQDECGPVGCNSLAFAGTFLVRSVAELEFVQQRGPLNILKAVTLPWDAANC